jgi:hypothetical protein
MFPIGKALPLTEKTTSHCLKWQMICQGLEKGGESSQSESFAALSFILLGLRYTTGVFLSDTVFHPETAVRMRCEKITSSK